MPICVRSNFDLSISTIIVDFDLRISTVNARFAHLHSRFGTFKAKFYIKISTIMVNVDLRI